MRLASLFPFALVAMMAGCAAETAAPQEDDSLDGTEDPAATSEDALTKRFHYTPSISEIDWLPGCGIRRPDGTACKMGFTLTYTKSYIDLQTTIRTSVNNRSKTITARIDTWSNSRIHPMVAVHPETIDLDVRNYQMGTTYKVVAKDYAGKVLWTGKLTPIPAP
jgi:hypothetical protein